MLPSRPAALLSLVLLSALPATAEPPRVPSCEAGVRYIELVADATGELPTVCIRPGVATNLFSDSKWVRVELERRELFPWVVETEKALTLVPSEDLRDGERFLLTVHFGDGAAPEKASFVLVVHPSQAERQVEVSRHPRPVASYRKEARAARAEALRCQQEKAHLQAECGDRAGLTGLVRHRLVSEEGVRSQNLSKKVTGRTGDPVSPIEVHSYCSATRHKQGDDQIVRLAVELELMNTSMAPWEVAGAALIGSNGQALRILEVWQSEPIRPGESRIVVVEVEVTEREARGPFTLKLWAGEEDGRSVTYGGITFP